MKVRITYNRDNKINEAIQMGMINLFRPNSLYYFLVFGNKHKPHYLKAKRRWFRDNYSMVSKYKWQEQQNI